MENTSSEAYKQTEHYQSLGIDKLQEQLAGYQTDDATLREQAEAAYKPTYDAQLEALKQQTAQQLQGYNSQLAGLGTAYDKQRRETNESYDQGAVNLSNALTKRGLGRSSLVATQGAYLEKQRGQALSDINASQTAAANAINEKIALLTDQAAQSERTLANSYAAQLESRITELRRENQTAATNLQLQIAALQQQGYQAYLNQLNADRNYELALREQQLAEDQFAYSKQKKSSSSSSATNAQNAVAPPPAANSDDLLNKLIGDAASTAVNWVSNAAKNAGSVVGGVLASLVSNKPQTTSTKNAPTTSAGSKFQSIIKK